MGERWVTAEIAKALDLVRFHNGIGWAWAPRDSEMVVTFADETRAAIERGDVPSPPVIPLDTRR